MTARQRASIVCVHERRVLLVRLEDGGAGRTYLFPPGGKIEPGESPLESAVRETLEETGYQVRAAPESETVLRYPFVWDGTVYDCTTHFFKATLVSTEAGPITPDPMHRGVVWLPTDELEPTFAFHTDLLGVMLKLARD